MYYKMVEGKQKEYPSWFSDKQCEEFDAVREVAGKISGVTGLVIFKEGELSVFIEIDSDSVTGEMIDAVQSLLKEGFSLDVSFILAKNDAKGIRYGL